ncbi:hypothetical protein TSMEX_011686 [Taenia solium]|eukprot:TsM_000743200 transcript=TsM_000743200 gene=TsM_000743200
MERLPASLRIGICKYLDAADIANLCEAVPSAKSVLKSLTIKGILRSHMGQVEWVDAKLCSMLHPTLAVVERVVEPVAEAESEGEDLCRAIRYYHEGCQLLLKHINHDLSSCSRIIHFLMLGRSIVELDLLGPFLRTLQDWDYKCGQQLYQKCSVGTGRGKAVAHMSNFDIHFNMNDLEEDGAQYFGSLEDSTISAFDGVVYMMDSALQCHDGRSLPLGLKRLINSITNIAGDKTTFPPILLILDAESKETGNLTSRAGHFECLMANLHGLAKIPLRGSDGCAANLSPYNWWKVCRLHQQDGIFVNMKETFQLTALQIIKTSADGSSQDEPVHCNKVLAHSPPL